MPSQTFVSSQLVRVDRDRLWSSLMELKQFGAYFDEPTGLTGVRRLALSDADVAARRTCMNWFAEAGLEVRVDQVGNVFGTRAGRDRALAPVWMGSHTDSVATGGAFDGPLGVLSSLEAIRAFNDAGVQTLRDVEVVIFTEEEGGRFSTDMIGSSVVAGRITLADALACTDAEGKTLGDELVRGGFNGLGEVPGAAPHAYVEVHIEQGPTLDRQGIDLGVVQGVQGISWQRLILTGQAAHAGATPIDARHDAALVAASAVIELRRMCDSGDFGRLRATVGVLDLPDGQPNVVPARAVMTMDLRNPVDADMAKAEHHIAQFIHEVARTHGVESAWERLVKAPAVQFSPDLQDLIAHTATELGLSHQPSISGAAHDAQQMASICPAAMIFVPSENGGLSHTPAEYSGPDGCAHGAAVLANTVRQLADQS